MSARNRPCSCGSGRRFKHCCGLIGASKIPQPVTPREGETLYGEMGQMLPGFRGKAMLKFCENLPPGRAEGLSFVPPGLLVIDQFLPRETCHRWRDYFDLQATRPATVQSLESKGAAGGPKFVLDPQRVTEFVPFKDLENEIRQVLVDAYKQTIIPHFGQELAWMERPEVLKYVPGGKYEPHSDNEYWNVETNRWIRSMDRDFSVLLYVNDDYEGGTLYFPNFDLRIRPREGMLIAFPSDHRFLHTAEPLESNERYVVVCWAADRSSHKLNAVPPGATQG